MEEYGKDEGDSSRQIKGGLAINSDGEGREFHEDWGNKTAPTCNSPAGAGSKGNDSLGIVSGKQADVHLKEILW